MLVPQVIGSGLTIELPIEQPCGKAQWHRAGTWLESTLNWKRLLDIA